MSMVPAAVQTKHSVVMNAISPPAASTQFAMAGPGTPSRSPTTITFFPLNIDSSFSRGHTISVCRLSLHRRVRHKQKREPVGKLRHAAKEEASFGHEHGVSYPSHLQITEGMAEKRHGCRNVTLGGREARHPALSYERVDFRSGDLLTDYRQCSHNFVVLKGRVAAAGGKRHLRVMHLGGVPV